MEEGDDLAAGAGGVGAKGGVADAVGDAAVHGPQDGLIVIGVGVHPWTCRGWNNQ